MAGFTIQDEIGTVHPVRDASPDFEGQQCRDFKKLQNVPRVIAIAISRLPLTYHIESGDFEDG